MVDYVTLMSRAVASLDRNSEDAREALYHRARAALVESLRTVEPHWSDDQIAAETAGLDAAIRQVESGIRRSARSPRAGRVQTMPPPQPPPRADTATDGDSAPLHEQSRFSPALIGVIGAVVLAIAAAGSYTYLSRPAAKSAPAALAGGGNAVKPEVSRQTTNKKTAEASSAKADDAAATTLPYGMGRQFVYYRSTYPAGTIIINKPQHTLYQVKAETVAIQYSIGVGPSCVDIAGLHHVSGRQEWPPFPPPAPGGQAQVASVNSGEHRAESRLGARILFLNDVEYGIHGTDKPAAIGRNSSFGCFLLMDDDITDLYERAPVDTHVVIMN